MYTHKNASLVPFEANLYEKQTKIHQLQGISSLQFCMNLQCFKINFENKTRVLFPHLQGCIGDKFDQLYDQFLGWIRYLLGSRLYVETIGKTHR